MPFAHVSGSNRGMGRSLGREFSRTAISYLNSVKSDSERKGVPWRSAMARAQEFLPYAQEHDPDYIEFIAGFSSSSGISFEDLFALICLGEKGMCTDICVNADATADGSVLSAHTEDWRPIDERHAVLVRGEPSKGPSFLVVTLAGLELVTGINSSGVSFTGNSLYQNDMRVGIPRMFAARKLLDARRIGDAISAAAPEHRASSYNTNLCHPSGEMYSVEASATDMSLRYPSGGYLVHTNHYLTPRMMRFEALFSGTTGNSLEHGASSLVRYHRADRLVRKNLGRITKGTLVSILGDHVNFPDSICAHENPASPEDERGKTIYAVIYDLTKQEMNLCLGNPCEGNWKAYSCH